MNIFVGNVNIRNMNSARVTDTFIFSGIMASKSNKQITQYPTVPSFQVMFPGAINHLMSLMEASLMLMRIMICKA